VVLLFIQCLEIINNKNKFNVRMKMLNKKLILAFAG